MTGIGGANGGAIYFDDHATGHMARIILDGDRTLNVSNGRLDISGLVSPAGGPGGTTVGSIEGGGEIYLGNDVLIVGRGSETATPGNPRQNLNAEFSGIIQDGGQFGGVGGQLQKVGAFSTLTLSGSNTYTGGTILQGGTLILNNPYAVGTNSGVPGTGNLTVNGGTLQLNPLAITAGTTAPVRVSGNYTQAAGTTLRTMVGGAMGNVLFGVNYAANRWGELDS